MKEKTLFGRQHETLLLCPHCGDREPYAYLHHSTVEVFARKEDSATGVHSVTTGVNCTVDNDVTKAIGRRDSISISMWCELCEGTSKYHIYQHKGQTYTYWTTD